ncbi:receptor activity-modifying protein 2 isoform X2 [Cololabis saira]|uniref:receptor activity-modifying protein 2 isoform X2 n=1 Tax=Cololabis saira TaxID=129043 RepID=UPI002AD43CB5|nr:receptor activity-modifying protein 2 isoform X2 [Cololabis saira]
MKGALGFIGVFLSFLSDVTGNSTVPSACGHKQTIDCGLYCGFCDHEFHGERIDCLALFLTHVCLFTFKNEMEPLNSSDWCIWGKVNRLYSNLSQCTEDMSDCLLIPWPNPLVEQTFVDIHSTYFQECPTEEFNDPPPSVVFALVITPICLIPLMVSLVVLKTKNGDGNS